MFLSVILLALSQALFQTASVLVVTVGGLAGGVIASSPQWATAPIAAMFLGTALATFPAARWMVRVGRRMGFACGAAFGTIGALIAAFGVWQHDLVVLSLGTFVFGVYQSFAQFYRFAAGEVASAAFRPKAIGLVLGGGIVAAFLGPTLARSGSGLLQTAYVGSFILLAVVSAVGVVVLLFLPSATPHLAAMAEEPEEDGRPWRQIVAQPAYLVALFGAATGYGVMILAMTATPLAMACYHHDLSASATVIQLHVLGMFLPSFFTGALIARFGAVQVMAVGLVLLTGHILLTVMGTDFTSFASALILLGVGWNFLYIGGTALLTSTYRPTEKGPAQATNDMAIFAISLVCSLSAGWLLQHLDWQTMNLLLLPWLAAAALALGAYGVILRRRAAACTS